ncbi:MAG: proline--tRNA ligase [Clostridia bacterium]|nr:MAG: proline--tRNA ligase [Clostridia bacterium]
MLASQLLAPTLRGMPAEAETVSHQLMLRAGLIRQVASGMYTHLPLGFRALQKVGNIIREEMDRAGGQELLLPIVQPAEIWQESGRWDVYGPEMFRLQDRHGRHFCLGPTHEELITVLVRQEVNSYRQLPLRLYQIQNKYRDERRPRFGVMRGREFVMKDMYSFDRDAAGMEESYRILGEAYHRVFSRCGLHFRMVEADTGAIGGAVSHEFMALAASGEAEIVYCPECDYAANVEKAACHPRPAGVTAAAGTGLEAAEIVPTPGARTMAEVAAYLSLPAAQLIKTLIYQADGRLVAVLVRGDRQVNEVKLQRQLGCLDLELAPDESVTAALGCPPGYVGPVGLPAGIPVYADTEVPIIRRSAAGANREGCHYVNLEPGRDFAADVVADLRTVEAGEPCPNCGHPLEKARGIEVGQIFQLGTKYSQTLGATYTDADGGEKPVIMGCYGIGVSRTVAAIIEQRHDEKGIIWPVSAAPFAVVVVPVSEKESRQMELARRVYGLLRDQGIEAVLDDRDERPGVKFADADLIGFPYRVTVGRRTLEQGTVDVKERATGQEEAVPVDRVSGYLAEALDQGR